MESHAHALSHAVAFFFDCKGAEGALLCPFASLRKADFPGSVAGYEHAPSVGALIIASLLSCTGLSAQGAAASPHLTIAAELQPIDGVWVQAIESRLATFERDAKIKVLMRGHAVSSLRYKDSQPGAYMRSLSAKLGVAQAGVLAVYFADVQEWRVWFGDELAPRFVGKPGTAREFTESGAMHDAKEAWLTEVFAKADKAFTARSATEARVLAQFQAEALIDGLIARLNPVR